MTVKEIINRLEELDETLGLYFYSNIGFMYTSDFICNSWRGSYDLPAIEVQQIESTYEATTVETAISNLRDCEGANVTGYKGGDYVLSEDNTLFLVPSFNSSGNCVGITNIDDSGMISIKSDMY